MKFLLKYWLPLLLWLSVIFIGSTDLMSAEHTSRFIVPFLRWLKPDISPQTVASIHVIIRKGAHLSEYAVLALLLLRAAIRMTNPNVPMLVLCAIVWVACVFVAVTDELHQTFVQSRGAAATDVLIDSVGALLGLLIGAAFARKRSTNVRKATAAP
ncbi:MAG: VanZ family protein [Verrucomicrobia bacterium]|nr:VanZ family protein [Verrucomicrobiota bacterium]